MTDKNKYSSPDAFKAALQDQLRKRAQGHALSRIQQLLVFDRLLARLAEEFGEAMVLKGGLALELRLSRARTTKDIDVRFAGDLDTLLPRLQRAGRQDLGDYMTFEIAVDPKHPLIEGEGTIYAGRRYRVAARLAGKPFGAKYFGLDVGVGDPMYGVPEEAVGEDYLGFANIRPPRLRIYPFETHLAEKLHAYTLPRPRERPNSRPKDLYDMALMSHGHPIESARLAEAIARTFGARGTHPRPNELPAPPSAWESTYAAARVEFDLPWPTLELCHRRAGAFVGPVLADIEPSRWQPEAGQWQRLA